MTLQARETFYYKGEELYSHSTPLSYRPNLPKFIAFGSFCWRGYRGTWSIKNSKLYLVDLYAHLPKTRAIPNCRYMGYDRRRKDLYYEIHLKDTYQKAYIEDVFPDIEDGKLFADWFSGDVNFGLNDVTSHGMACSYEKYLSLTFEDGFLVRERARDHDDIYPPKSVEEIISLFRKFKKRNSHDKTTMDKATNRE